MKCAVCGYDKLEEGMGSCPICKFPVIYITDDSPESSKMIENLVKDYRKKVLKAVKVFLVIHQYRTEGETLKDTVGKLELELPIVTGSVTWEKQPFARVEQEELEIELEIQRFTLAPIKKTVTVKMPQLKELWNVGLELTEELEVLLAVGNRDIHTKSVPIPLFN